MEISVFRRSHDRFLCIDDTVYHVGASIKDLGKKWFAFSKMEDFKPEELVAKINEAFWKAVCLYQISILILKEQKSNKFLPEYLEVTDIFLIFAAWTKNRE